MKQKHTLLIVLLAIVSGFASAQNRLNIGLSFSVYANPSKFTGGMAEASALFNNHPYGSCQLGLEFRYRVSNHWSLQSGLHFGQTGFSYSLAQDYNLLNPSEQYAELYTGTCLTQIPVMAIYNTKLNCRHIRFIVGAGFNMSFIDNGWTSYSASTVEAEGVENNNTTEMTEQTTALTTTGGGFTWLIGIEKVFKRGNMLSLTFNANHGFNNMALSTVSYTVENQDYTHIFTNRNNWAGVALTYYFLPAGSRKQAKSGQ